MVVYSAKLVCFGRCRGGCRTGEALATKGLLFYRRRLSLNISPPRLRCVKKWRKHKSTVDSVACFCFNEMKTSLTKSVNCFIFAWGGGSRFFW